MLFMSLRVTSLKLFFKSLVIVMAAFARLLMVSFGTPIRVF